MRFLFVDNGVFTASIIQLALISTASNFEYVRTGQQALERTTIQNYDALFLDLVLPDMDGYDVIRQLRKTSNTIKIYVISSFFRPEAKTKAVQLGANAFLTYPLSEAELMRHLKTLIFDNKTV